MQVSFSDRGSEPALGQGGVARMLPSALPAGSPASGSRPRFGQLLGPVAGHESASVLSAPYQIRAGDTLSAIALGTLKAQGLPHGPAEIADAVRTLAQANGLANPDRIYAGHTLRLDALERRNTSAAAGRPSQLVAVRPLNNHPATPRWPVQTVPAAKVPVPTSAWSATLPQMRPLGSRQFPVLEQTLDRAVEQGYVPPSERAAVRDRIVAMADKYKFSPDDFATVSLMESAGLNPRASNGRCFGIIQFCGGSQAGAAAVGLEVAPQQILDRPVLQQLDLVDQYFEHNGLQRMPRVGLVDLYLTILTPSARGERTASAPLPIQGKQARLLHENQDRSQPITRKSILTGLLDHARQMLSAPSLAAPGGRPSGNPGGNSLPLPNHAARHAGRPLG